MSTARQPKDPELSAEEILRQLREVYGEPFEFTVLYYGDKLARHEAVHLPHIAGIVSSLNR